MSERALRANQIDPDKLLTWHQWLTETWEELGTHDSQDGGRAYRLADEVFGLLPPDQQERLYQ